MTSSLEMLPVGLSVDLSQPPSQRLPSLNTDGMGSVSSKSAPSPVLDIKKSDSDIADREAELSQRTLNDVSGVTQHKTLDVSLFSKWENRLLSDRKNRLALSAFTQGDILNIIRSREAMINDGQHVFSVKLADEGKPVTNQRKSGRCWMFAATNVMRVRVIKK
jgi:bleomycin hydrolase